MSIRGFMEVVAAVSLAVPVFVGGLHYKDTHLPEFEIVQAKILFQECMDRCKAVALKTCELNGIPPEACEFDCSHCYEFIQDGG